MEELPVGMKRCPRCTALKIVVSEFSITKRGQAAAWCKRCVADYSKEHYTKNKEKKLLQCRKYEQSNRDKVSARKRKQYEHNKDKYATRAKDYRQRNKEIISIKAKEYQERTKEARVVYSREYYLENKDRITEQQRVYYSQNREKKQAANLVWKTKNPERSRALQRVNCANRKAAVLQRRPKWFERKEVREFYANCPPGHHVDHVIPLRSKKVSGLHVLSNLQYLPAHENEVKLNKFNPDEHFWVGEDNQ